MKESKIIIHDIKNNLTAINTLVELIREECPDSENIQAWLNKLEEAVERCSRDLGNLN